MSYNQTPPPKSGNFAKALLIAIAIILIFEIGFHLLLPLFGIAVITAGVLTGAWGVVIVTIVFLSIAGLLFFIIPGALILLLAALSFIWVVVAIVIFPIVFPIIFPVFIILLFIAYVRRQKK